MIFESPSADADVTERGRFALYKLLKLPVLQFVLARRESRATGASYLTRIRN